MAQKSYKKIITAAFVALVLSVSALVVNKTNAVFPGPNDPIVNGKIVYASSGGKTLTSSYPDGSEPTTLFTDSGATIVGDAVWSEDRSKIAFVMAKNNQTHIYTINGTDANQTPVQLTTGAGESGGTDPSWSEDGLHIVFARQDGGASNIFVMNADGTNQTKLTDYTSTDVQAFDPHWSPKVGSRQIVYTAASQVLTPPMDADIHTAVINAGFTALTSDVKLEGASWNEVDDAPDKVRGEYDAQFDATGDKVVFVRRTTGGSYTIGTVPADGSSTTFSTVVPNTTTGGPVFDPAMSPDGNYLSYEPKSNALSIGAIKIYNIDNGSQVNFTNAGAEADWTYAGEGEVTPPALTDVNIECTTEVGKPCTITVPEFCVNEIVTGPARGTSVITGNSLTYTPTTSSNEEENYVHVRDNGISTAKCNVKIKFTTPGGTGVVPNIPKTGIVGGLIGVGLAAAVAGGAIYYKEQKGKKNKKLNSEK